MAITQKLCVPEHRMTFKNSTFELSICMKYRICEYTDIREMGPIEGAAPEFCANKTCGPLELRSRKTALRNKLCLFEDCHIQELCIVKISKEGERSPLEP